MKVIMEKTSNGENVTVQDDDGSVKFEANLKMSNLFMLNFKFNNDCKKLCPSCGGSGELTGLDGELIDCGSCAGEGLFPTLHTWHEIAIVTFEEVILSRDRDFKFQFKNIETQDVIMLSFDGLNCVFTDYDECKTQFIIANKRLKEL